MATHMDIPYKDRRIDALEARVKLLEDAIKKHRDQFPDEPLEGEHELWKNVENC